jgi:histidinol-phosphatase (PHP family)
VYPAPAFLAMFAAAGVPITLASDAHFPEECAIGRDEVVAAAGAAGYTEHLRFRRRRADAVPLPGSPSQGREGVDASEGAS